MHSRRTVNRVLAQRSGLVFWWLLLLAFWSDADGLPQGSSQDELYCLGGVCVDPYLCANGTIVTNGEGLIDQRVASEDCPSSLVCCRSFENTEHVSSSEGCAGTCVPFYNCLDDLYGDDGKQVDGNKASHCPGDDVCCGRVRQSGSISAIQGNADCLGKCVPSSQCLNRKQNAAGKDLIDLRLTDDSACGDDLVCCRESDATKPVIQVPKVCEGICVPAAQCSNSSEPGRIDLRSYGEACPQGLICCNQKSQPTISTPTHKACQCVAVDQCLDGISNNPVTFDLRVNDENCIGGQVCCKNLRPTVEVPKICEGTCVPLSQCSRSAAQGLIDLRGLDGTCSDDLICCPAESITVTETTVSSHCQCTPSQQCLDSINKTTGQDLIDLRLDGENCIEGEVCCVNAQPPSEGQKIRECKGTCVPSNRCQTTNTSFDLRTYDDCPENQICCEGPLTPEIIPLPSSCDGRCVPFEQCTSSPTILDLIDLRSADSLCPANLVCCKQPEPIPEFTCRGQCVPAQLCDSSSKDILDLRLQDNSCPPNMVCCDSPKPETPEPVDPTCLGVCIPLAECDDTPRDMMAQLDLRLQSAGNGCPEATTICCANPRKVSPDQMKWTGWITDINNMIGDGQQPDVTGTEKCSPRVNLNSEDVSEQEIPWLVTVWSRQQPNSYLCAGSLIRADVVLIPADCAQGLEQSQLVVRSGDYNLKAKAGFVELHVSRFVTHPDYNGPTSSNNVALLFLNQPGDKSNAAVACLFDTNEPFDENNCLLVGWDSLNLLDVSSLRSVPRKHPLTSLASASCQPGYLCTSQFQQSTANYCDRLRGSPIVCRDRTGRYWKQAALVSQQNQRCDASGIPELLVPTSPSYLWIREQLSPSFVQRPAVQEPSRWYLPSV